MRDGDNIHGDDGIIQKSQKWLTNKSEINPILNWVRRTWKFPQKCSK